jgi:hypothetical protein
MPLVRIDLPRSLYEKSGAQIGPAVHQAQIDTLHIPVDDKFQVFTPHDDGELTFDPHYNGVDRRSLVVIQITLVQLYSVATKRELYAAVVNALAPLGVRPDDILISLVENTYEDWYGGVL